MTRTDFLIRDLTAYCERRRKVIDADDDVKDIHVRAHFSQGRLRPREVTGSRFDYGDRCELDKTR